MKQPLVLSERDGQRCVKGKLESGRRPQSIKWLGSNAQDSTCGRPRPGAAGWVGESARDTPLESGTVGGSSLSQGHRLMPG